MLKSRAWSNLTDRVPNALKVLGPDLKVSDVWDATRRVDEPQPEDGPTGESTRRNRSDRDELRAPVVPSGGHLSNWSWRAFFGACRVVASREARRLSCPIPVFDVSMIAPQSLSCLVLEIWMSEILTELFVKSTSEKSTPSNQKELEKFLVTFHNSWDQKREFGLDQLAKKYKKALERALLLIAGAIDLRTIFDPDKPFGFRSRGASLSAVASRHWYKTAVEFQGQMPTEEPLTPACLPGHYSTRGDWYLAALKNGRSSRLADRVLDVLNSRRANMTRLQAGLGLPVRDLLPFENDREKWGFRTRLLTESDGRRQGVPP